METEPGVFVTVPPDAELAAPTIEFGQHRIEGTMTVYFFDDPECGCVPGHRMGLVSAVCKDCGYTEQEACEDWPNVPSCRRRRWENGYGTGYRDALVRLGWQRRGEPWLAYLVGWCIGRCQPGLPGW